MGKNGFMLDLINRPRDGDITENVVVLCGRVRMERSTVVSYIGPSKPVGVHDTPKELHSLLAYAHLPICTWG